MKLFSKGCAEELPLDVSVFSRVERETVPVTSESRAQLRFMANLVLTLRRGKVSL